MESANGKHLRRVLLHMSINYLCSFFFIIHTSIQILLEYFLQTNSEDPEQEPPSGKFE